MDSSGCAWCDPVDETWVTVAGPTAPHEHTMPVSQCPWCKELAGATAAVKGGKAATDADTEFAQQVTKALAVVRNRRVPFSAPDVRAVLDEWGVKITRPNAIGAAFRSAARAGLIVKTGRLVDSTIKVQHGHSHPEWVSA